MTMKAQRNLMGPSFAELLGSPFPPPLPPSLIPGPHENLEEVVVAIAIGHLALPQWGCCLLSAPAYPTDQAFQRS